MSDAIQHLKIQHLRLIAALDRLGQLGQAAQALSLTQPAASRMLAEIEARLGAPVCTRLPRGVTMTRLGRVLARRAQNILLELRDTAREVTELNSGTGGVAALGAVTGGALAYMVPAIQQLTAISPHADITVEVGPSDVLVPALLEGRIDFALARVPQGTDTSGLAIAPARPEEVQLLVRADHPLSSARRVTLAELAPYQWIMQAQGTPIRSGIDAAFRDRGLDQPRRVIATPSLLVMIAMVSSSTAIAPVSREVADLLTGRSVAARFVVLPLDRPLLLAPYYLLTARDRSLSPLAERLQALVRAELARR